MPDLLDTASEPEDAIANELETWAAQHVNRWVYLKHQREQALRELRCWMRALLATAKER